MNNIEKLAIEHGSTCYTGQQYHFNKWQLEAFAKALQQSSEPVCNLWVDPATLNYEVDRCTHPLDELIPVFTHPPASVSLEKYNRAIEALKCIDEDLVNPVYYRLVKEAIAEAEGKEG